MRGLAPTNRERRATERAAKVAKAGRWTIDKLWTEWKFHNADKGGLTRDNWRYGKHLEKPFGGMEPNDILPLDVDRLRAKLIKDGYAKDSVVSVLSLLRRIANYGMDRQLCAGLSFRIKMPKGRAERTETLTPEQMAAYIKVCREWPDPQVGNFSLFVLHTGMRRGEVMKLKWSDVDLEQGFLRIVDPKGGKDQTIPLSDAVQELLENHPRIEGSEYVFVRKDGRARSVHQVVVGSRAIRDAAGLPKDFRPSHGFRHSFASALSSSGQVTIQQLMMLLTHKTPAMTMRYSHLADEALKRSANVMGSLVKKAGRAK
jgi:integrase